MNWTDLIVTAADGSNVGTLGEFMAQATRHDTRKMLLLSDGTLQIWDGYFISAPGEDPEHDTPRGKVDWAGFRESVTLASNREEEQP